MFSLTAALHCFAHDPYEISSTIRIETNRTEVEIEMEFNTAMLLIGAPRVGGEAEQAAVFQSKLPELQQQAARFFGVGGGSGSLIAASTNVALGVENHVKFNLEFPAAHSGLKLDAAAVRSLGSHGHFGVAVTVLDMVNLKVLGQSVLFSNSPPAEFGPIPAKTPDAKGASTQAVTNVLKKTSPLEPAVSVVPEQPSERSTWRIAGLLLGAFALLVLIWLWQKRGSGRAG